MTTTNWTNKAYAQIVAKYPALEDKSTAVALCVWAYSHDPNCPVEKLREWAKVDGITIGGRAQGSAREILGLKPKITGARKTRLQNTRATRIDRRFKVQKPRSMKGRSRFDELIAQARGETSSATRMRSALVKMRELIDGALAK